MPEDIVELLCDNVREVFGKSDADRRRAIIERPFVEHCIAHAPRGVVKGWAASGTFADGPNAGNSGRGEQMIFLTARGSGTHVSAVEKTQ